MDASALREWRSGWGLVLSSSIGASLTAVLVYANGLFVQPLQAEFGWSRTEITSGLLINSLVGVTLAPVIGILIDRFGPRRIALPGVVCYCVALAMFSTVTSSLAHWWLLWFGLALCMMPTSPIVWASGVASRFERSRGLALAITLSGTGLTGMIAPQLGGYVMSEYGWRTAFWVLAAAWGAVTIPLVVLFFYGASDRVRTSKIASTAKQKPDLPGLTGREALSTTRFYRLAFAVLLVMLSLSGLLVHTIPIFIDAKMDPMVAASSASLIGLTIIIGRVGAGFLLDRFDGRWVGALFFALPIALMLVLLAFDGNPAWALLIAALLGLCTGAEFDIAAYLTARYFGMKTFGFLFGIIGGLLAFAMGVGPAIYGSVYDNLGSYDLAFYIAMPALALASILIATLGRPNSDFSAGSHGPAAHS